MHFTIRAMTDADLPAMVVLRNLPGVRHGTLSIPFESIDRWRHRRAEALNKFEGNLVACAGDLVIGHAILERNRNARRNHVGTIGIMVHDDWVGQGAGTKLFAALIDLADNWLGLRRLELGVFVDNAPAIALYRKFGFEIEAAERADAYRNGAYVDAYLMARLQGELPRNHAPAPALPPQAPPGAFTLRAAEPADADAVAGIFNQPLVRHNTLRLPFGTGKDGLPLGDVAGQTCILAIDGAAPVGIGLLQRAQNRRAHVAELICLAVHDEWGGRGIGPALLGALLDVADHWLNLKRIGLTVYADNKAAIALYQKLGFEIEGVRRADAFRAGGFADMLAMGRIR